MTRQLFIVAYPVLGEVGGLLLDADGTKLAVMQSGNAPELVENLADQAAEIDPTSEVTVVPGWDKAPEGLRERYDVKREAARPFRLVLDPEEEAQLAAARRALGQLDG